MATLNEVMKETADAIREKTGKSELIKPVDFASEIKSISAGGGESGGEREVTYYSIPNDAEVVMKRLVIGYATYIKGTLATGTKIIEMAGSFVMRSNNVHDYAEAVAIEWDAFHTNVSGTSVTCREDLAQLAGISVEEFSQFVTPITEAEFYDLNA
jgi:hypothetical protein